MRIKRKALRENLADLLQFIEHACVNSKLSDMLQKEIKMAVEEACVNIIDYGYRGLPVGDIAITFQITGPRVMVTIKDSGINFDPSTYPPVDTCASLDQRQEGGLGIHLMRELMDEICYSGIPGKENRLELIKDIY